MDKIKELQHQVSIMDAIIQAVPKPYNKDIADGIRRFRDEQSQIRKEIVVINNTGDSEWLT